MKSAKKPFIGLKNSKFIFTVIALTVILGITCTIPACGSTKGNKENDKETAACEETASSKNDLKELEELITKAYLDFNIYDLMSPDFLAAQEASVNGEEFCIDWDFFYNTQEDVVFENKPRITAEAIDASHANVLASLDFKDWGYPVIMHLSMVKDQNTGKWLVDDVLQDGSERSIKQMMIDCANAH